ncbi:uncharacterized protein B0P05DRAFT_536190 [Gilbertella persicaria]|uniref:uncharacterized protein n=1 Tax=Gilbertella persicaria TaxID=101096 RepID=UPI00221ED43C|nr:uncharacterized protein B0P05DRAFT_536190 [Gilbertella persicaria]KAI8084109.1 hypothetical protein B0P05DRAFT_536190 [Gilbertella persicaria]
MLGKESCFFFGWVVGKSWSKTDRLASDKRRLLVLGLNKTIGYLFFLFCSLFPFLFGSGPFALQNLSLFFFVGQILFLIKGKRGKERKASLKLMALVSFKRGGKLPIPGSMGRINGLHFLLASGILPEDGKGGEYKTSAPPPVKL